MSRETLCFEKVDLEANRARPGARHGVNDRHDITVGRAGRRANYDSAISTIDECRQDRTT